ncbi:golvesin C-terminal-like domain-containing protein [Micromonospora sp. BQ11]|uniref:golvesin C-terminal-like domain-containing protein n=1 Tax=Micromonospora sp. BQ11 TaxID=3452212 RepID=UPI003F8B769B
MRRLLASGVIAVLVATLVGTPARAAELDVVPVDWARFTAALPTDGNSTLARSVLLSTNKYALGTWWTGNFGSQTGTYLTLGGTGEHQVRPPASQAYALAISLKTGAYDPQVTGVSRADALARAERLTTSVAYRHRANSSGGWGAGWQSAYWAALAGTAGWLLWDDLSSTDRAYVRAMVISEADRFIGYRVPYYRDAAGTVVTAGDSKAEENAWNAMLLNLAVVMLPSHGHRHAWLYKLTELQLSAFARPQDTTSTTRYNGRAIKDWLYGSNANADATVTNHGFVHPDYMATIDQNTGGALMWSLAGQAVPVSARYGVDRVYDAFVDLTFTSPPYASPGGTMYVPGSGDAYYPQSNDWGTGRRAHFATVDALAALYGFDQFASVKAPVWEALHAGRVQEMQARSTDGRTYTSSGEDTYTGRESWVARQAATSWLAKFVKAQSAFRTADPVHSVVVDNEDREAAVRSGTWTVGTSGARILRTEHYHVAGSGSSAFRFAPRLSATGSYRIYAWWNAYPNHGTNVPYLVRTSDGATTTVRVDQTANGGRWNLLGTFSLAAGSSSFVEVTNDANGYVVADAVRFEPA